MRIIVAASTDRLNRVVSLVISRSFTVPSIRELSETHTMNTAIASSAFMLPDTKTSENSISLSFGVRRPISVTAIVPITTRAISVGRRFSTMYRSKPGMPIFVDGNGL